MRKAHAIVAVVAAGALAAPAAAQTPPYSPQQICGAGFGVIDAQDLYDGKAKLGTIYLLWNPNTQRNCVTTVKTRGVGTATRTTAGIWAQNGSRQYVDVGMYKYYAGPRKVKAPHTCVMWGGSIDVGKRSGAYESPYEHCS